MASAVWDTVDTPCGQLLLVGTDIGLVAVGLHDPDDVLERVAASGVSSEATRSPRRLDAERRQFHEYFDGSRRTFDIALDWSLSDGFRREVLEQLLEVPYGETVTYGELAALTDSPKAVRAVGTAMATNPLPIVVPCHRVVRAGGALGKYGGGVEMKRWLLTMEADVGGG